MECLPPEIILNHILPQFYEALFDSFSYNSLLLTSKYFYNILSKNQEYIVKNYNKINHKEYYIKKDFKTVREGGELSKFIFFPELAHSKCTSI